MAHLFYKVVQASHQHFEQSYKEGLNISARFDPDPESKRGIWYCHFNDIPRWINHVEADALVYQVHLCLDSLVVWYPHKFKTNTCKLKNPVPLQEFLDRNFDAMYLVKADPWNLRFTMGRQKAILEEMADIRDKELVRQKVEGRHFYNDMVSFYAVDRIGATLQFVLEQKVEIVLCAVRQTPYAIQYSKYQPEEACEEALRRDGLIYPHIRHKRPHYRLLAVQQNGLALQFIPQEDQTDELCEIACKQNGYAIKYVKYPRPWHYVAAAEKTPQVISLFPEPWRTIVYAKDHSLASRLERHAFLLTEHS